MKKTLFYILMVIFFTYAGESNAQSLATFLGIKMGPSFANFEGKDVSTGLTSRIGFGFGVVSDFSIKKANDRDYSRLSLCPEINLVPGGAIDKSTSGTVTNDITYKFNYLRVPVLIRFYHGFLGKAKTGLFAEAGCYGGYLISAQSTGKIDGFSADTLISKEDFEDLDYGFSFGGGVSLASILSINYRYDWGLANIKSATLSKDNWDWTNRTWGIYFNLMLPLGGK